MRDSRGNWDRTARGRLRRPIALTATVVAASLLVPAGGASAEAAKPTLRLSAAAPIAGEIVKISANLPGRSARPVRLQRKAGSRWITVTTKRSDRFVNVAFRRKVAAEATTYRAVAGTGAKRRVSTRVTIRPQRQTARLLLPAKATTGESLRATAVFAPARSGRPVVFQHRVGTSWRTIATARQNRDGQATATLRMTSSSTHRVVASAFRGAKTTTSATTRVTVTPTPTPTPTPPPVPSLRCDLPADGTVTWGAGDASHTRRSIARLDATTADGQPVTSKDVYSPSTLVLTEPGADPVTLGARLRVRGNSTSMVSMKYPYKVKLDAKTGVLGMPESKDFVLLANFFDRSLLRNDVGFEVARRLGAPWTPRMHQVDLYLNGTYKGLYQWGEGIETEPSRVGLEAGAVLLEADSYADTDPHFTTPRDLQVFVKSSDDESVLARTSDRVGLIEDVLYSDHFADPVHGYRACLDVDSFVDAYLVAELTKNIDAAFNNSVWMVLGADGRLAMGPAWDFDMGMGNRFTCGIDDPQGWFVNRDWLVEQPLTPKCFPTQMQGPRATGTSD